MATEDASYISELNAAYPADGDAVGEGGGTTTGTGSTRGHLNMIKYALKTQFSGLAGTTAVTASEAEMNYLDITTLGTSADSKALTQSAGGVVTVGATSGNQVLDIASHDLVDGGLKLAGTLVTASATEMNLLDGKSAIGDAVLSADQSWSGSQRGTPQTITQGTDIDLDTGNNFLWTPAAADQLSFDNETTGQSGFIKLINPSAYVITLGSEVKAVSTFATDVTTAGTYLVTYFCDGTNVYVSASAILV